MKFLIGVAALLLVAACGQTTPSTGGPSADNPSLSEPTLTPSGPATGATPPIEVLPAAQAYVDAVARRDLDGLVRAFHADGRIVDVSRTIAGHDAIRTWADNEVIGGTLRVIQVVEQRPDGQKLLVHWAPAGSDGWRAHYDFTVRDDRISVANLQYA
jgi:hypothetical protein